MSDQDMSVSKRARRALAAVPARSRVRSIEVLHAALASPLVSCSARARLLRLLFGFRVHGRLSSGVRLTGVARLTVGRDSFINTDCLFDLSEEIQIGRGVHVAPRVSIYTSSHRLGGAAMRGGEVVRAPVTISDGCWVGANAILLAGVTLGPGVVVAAGAVVTKSLLEPGVYAGTPARRVRDLEDELRPLRASGDWLR